MATYTFRPVPAWGQVGQFARIGIKKVSTFPVTKLDGSPATVVQGGVTKVGYLESDSNGLIDTFTTTDIPRVVTDLGFGQITINSDEAFDGASSKVAKGEIVISVKDYGAVGDNTANDTTAFTSAITAAAAAKLPLFIPGGHYKISSTLDIPDGLVMRGAGHEPTNGTPTRLNFTSLNGTATAGITIIDGSDIVLSDFYVTGRASGSGNEIQFTGLSRSVSLARITVNTSTTGSAIAVATAGGASHSLINSKFEQVKIAGGANGIWVGGSSTSLHLDNCYVMSTTNAGYLLQGTYLSLNACAADSNALYAYLLQNAIGVSFNGCGSETTGRTGWHLTGAKHIHLAGCRAVNNNTTANVLTPSFMGINDASDYVTTLDCVDTTPNATTSNSVRNWNGTAPTRFTPIDCDFTAKGVNVNVNAGLNIPQVTTDAGTTTRSPLRIPHGSAPTSPVNGDIWTTTAGLFVRINGATVGPLT